ncbi:hypothetical protein IKE80_00815 [Candidatus Saccharibacteria bacterium]|nr:hypothetical protein [Candidatus Saccharibacteria bacterium]
MDNGQHGQTPPNQELFTDGITAGVGIASEKTNPLPPDNNLDSEEFGSQDFGSRGNAALKSSTEEMPMSPFETATTTPDFAEPDNVDTGELGKVIKTHTPPFRRTALDTAEQTYISSATPNKISTDAEVKKRFSDGKVNKDDQAYLESKINELSTSDLAALVDFRNEACAAMQNSPKEPK